MRLLFELDAKDYNPDGRPFFRPSARGIIIKDGKVAMVHSLRYDYYKFPGGGLEPGEDAPAAMIREVREESGLKVVPASVREYGLVRRMQKNDMPGYEYFYQENFYFLCDAEEQTVSQDLDDYEAEAGFVSEWVEPERAIHINRYVNTYKKSRLTREREARVLEILMEEGYFDKKGP